MAMTMKKILEQMVQDAEMRREQHRNILLDLLEKTEAVSSLLYEKHLSREKMGRLLCSFLTVSG